MTPTALDEEQLTSADDDYNPLECQVCRQARRVQFISSFIARDFKDLVQPIRLPCQHCCCLRCAAGRSACTICECAYIPQQIAVDKVLDYVVASSNEATETCANCDKVSGDCKQNIPWPLIAYSHLNRCAIALRAKSRFALIVSRLICGGGESNKSVCVL